MLPSLGIIVAAGFQPVLSVSMPMKSDLTKGRREFRQTEGYVHGFAAMQKFHVDLLIRLDTNASPCLPAAVFWSKL
ncbi:MAG: hypothetical protein ACXIVE_00605 [Salinarimonas sp.]